MIGMILVFCLLILLLVTIIGFFEGLFMYVLLVFLFFVLRYSYVLLVIILGIVKELLVLVCFVALGTIGITFYC